MILFLKINISRCPQYAGQTSGDVLLLQDGAGLLELVVGLVEADLELLDLFTIVPDVTLSLV